MSAIDIDLHIKIQTASSINIEETFHQLTRLLEARRYIARKIVDDDYDDKTIIELFNYCNADIQRLLGI